MPSGRFLVRGVAFFRSACYIVHEHRTVYSSYNSAVSRPGRRGGFYGAAQGPAMSVRSEDFYSPRLGARFAVQYFFQED